MSSVHHQRTTPAQTTLLRIIPAAKLDLRSTEAKAQHPPPLSSSDPPPPPTFSQLISNNASALLRAYSTTGLVSKPAGKGGRGSKGAEGGGG